MPKLNKRTVTSVQPAQNKDVVLWDNELSGFGLRVKPSGKKTFILQYRLNGRSRRMSLGQLGPLTPQQARAEAIRCFGEIVQGVDPAAERKNNTAATTIAVLAERYLEQHARLHKKPNSIREDERLLAKHVIPSMGQRRVVDVTHKDVAQLHANLKETPYLANRVLALLSKMFSLSQLWGLRDDGTNPCKHVQRFRETHRERLMTPEEFSRLGAALDQAEQNASYSSLAIQALRLLVLTGCRRDEVRCLRWTEVDLANACLRLEDTKTGERIVRLCEPAVELLGNIPKNGSQWVFPGKAENKPLGNLNVVWSRVRADAGLPDIRLHDLRHAFASVAVAQGLSLPVIGALLGHQHSSTTQRYAHLSDSPLRIANEHIGTHIASALATDQIHPDGLTE